MRSATTAPRVSSSDSATTEVAPIRWARNRAWSWVATAPATITTGRTWWRRRCSTAERVEPGCVQGHDRDVRLAGRRGGQEVLHVDAALEDHDAGAGAERGQRARLPGAHRTPPRARRRRGHLADIRLTRARRP